MSGKEKMQLNLDELFKQAIFVNVLYETKACLRN